MKLPISKQVDIDIDIELPLFFLREYTGAVGIISEEKAVVISESFFSIYSSGHRTSIEGLLSDYEPENQITKEEFEKIFNTAKQNINDFQL